MKDIFTPEIEVAIQAVRQAASLIIKIQNELVVSALKKNDKSPVTVADYSSQAVIGYYLSQRYPNIPLVAEETSTLLHGQDGKQVLNQVMSYVSSIIPETTQDKVFHWIDWGNNQPTDKFWTLDPIDGTKGFLRGDQYAVALALMENNMPCFGILGCPRLNTESALSKNNTGTLILGVRGHGSWITSLTDTHAEWRQIKTSNQVDIKAVRVLRSFESGHTNTNQLDVLLNSMGVLADPILVDSQVKYALLAMGEGEMLIRLLSPDMPDYKEKIWDHAAGAIILEEAGGKISDLFGNPLDFSKGRTLNNNRGVLASNTIIHNKVLDAIATISP